MAASPKIVLSRSQDIPFNKLVLSQANVRRVKAGVSVEALAESIARHSLLQSLTVRPVLDADGQETGLFEVPVGGRRFRALELLVAQKRMNKTAPVPCIIRTDGIAEEHSLAENTDREALHPARPVPRLPDPAREGPRRGGDRRRLRRHRRRGPPAPEAGRRLARACSKSTPRAR